jgi:mannan endo-1,4-beta-mannosidase
MILADPPQTVVSARAQKAVLPWVTVRKSLPGAVAAPYFELDTGATFTPIGQNDAITWPELVNLLRRKDSRRADAYIRMLADHSVTVLRLMLEYSQFDRSCFERPAGKPQPDMVRLWDDIFALCEENGLRVLLTPFDTFWMWIRWDRHPYAKENGGPCADRARILLCPDTRRYIKDRLSFMTEHWGSSGAVFAWDLWNEIHPSYAGNSADCFADFITDLSEHMRNTEMRLHGRSHPQTVSMFGPHLVLDHRIPDAIFRHPLLDFASTHFYEEGTIDYPLNTVDAALSCGRLMREALRETPADRPFLDSEHGPIHMFKDHKKTLPAPFDDEYFRHFQWAHLAGGGAGGGMRWPNRHPHSLTPGMRVAQRALAGFLPLVNWLELRRRNLNDEVEIGNPVVKAVACGDERQAIAWLVRTDSLDEQGMLRRDVGAISTSVGIPGLRDGVYRITAWNTVDGFREGEQIRAAAGDWLRFEIPVAGDVAVAVGPA